MPLINKPTRFTSKSTSPLDHMWTRINFAENITAAIIIHPLSDHLLVYLCYDPNSTARNLNSKDSQITKIALFNDELQSFNIDLFN